MMTNPITIEPVAWLVQRETMSEEARVVLDVRIVNRGETNAPAYAITHGEHVTLNKRGQWEPEPLPSARSEAYKRRCRWSDFEQAKVAAVHAFEALEVKFMALGEVT